MCTARPPRASCARGLGGSGAHGAGLWDPSPAHTLPLSQSSVPVGCGPVPFTHCPGWLAGCLHLLCSSQAGVGVLLSLSREALGNVHLVPLSLQEQRDFKPTSAHRAAVPFP